MKNLMCQDSVSLNIKLNNKERISKYKLFSLVFSYPDDEFFKFFTEQITIKEELLLEYDNLFRSLEVWLYGCEYYVQNEFQRVESLADINGFYKAFGLEVNKDRPDALSCELEFMHYLIFKEVNALDNEKADICRQAQRKFFTEHLGPAAKKITEKVCNLTKNKFYKTAAQEFTRFLGKEEMIFQENS